MAVEIRDRCGHRYGISETDSEKYHICPFCAPALLRAVGEGAQAKITSAERQRDEAYATVKRIWQALGITDYQQAQPSGIAEHVESVLRQRDEAIAALRGEWVAVSERLPMLEPVLGVFAGGSQMVVILDVIEGWQDAETREELLQAPTHWKPLSEPPESARRLLNQQSKA